MRFPNRVFLAFSNTFRRKRVFINQKHDIRRQQKNENCLDFYLVINGSRKITLLKIEQTLNKNIKKSRSTINEKKKMRI